VVCAWPDEEELVEVFARLIILRNGTEKGEKASVGVGLPKLFDTVDTERPARWEFGWQLAAVLAGVDGISLMGVSVREFGVSWVGMPSTAVLRNDSSKVLTRYSDALLMRA
jgi:hypothetical protein